MFRSEALRCLALFFDRRRLFNLDQRYLVLDRSLGILGPVFGFGRPEVGLTGVSDSSVGGLDL